MIAARGYENGTAAVMGLARSGLASTRALIAGGARVLAWDENPERRRAARDLGAEIVDLARADFSGVAALVLSPGIPHTWPAPHPAAARARAARVPIVGDIELLARAAPSAVTVGVTGTNGKSTTTALIGHILAAAGRPCEVGGNIGRPVLAFDAGEDEDDAGGPGRVHALELSSYQLELAPSLSCAVAVLLNIAPDHLDRHGGMEGYIAAKRHVFDNMGPGATAAVGAEDEVCLGIARELRRRPGLAVVPVSGRAVPEGGVGADGRRLVADFAGPRRILADLDGARALPGAHNAQNAAAAAAAALALGVDDAAIGRAIADFPGLPHRQERVGEAGGVLYVNDSKATNAEAAARALSCYGAIYWIAGGRAKEGGIAGLEPWLPRVRRAFLIGEAAPEFAAALEGRAGCEVSGALDRALAAADALARREGRPGATVLLSPAAASFDQFESYEARGDRFRELVRARLAAAGAPAGRAP